MNDVNTEKNVDVEIDITRVFSAVWQKAVLVIVVSLLCAVAAYLISAIAITPKYESAAMFYVNNNSLSVGDASFSISSGDLSTSRNLVDSYIVILNTRETLNDVIDYAGASLTHKELKEMISAAAVNETEIFQVTVTSDDPREAEKLANAIAYILPKRISTIIDGTSAKVVDAAVVASSPSSPNNMVNAVIGFILGFVIVVAVIVLKVLFDVTIRTEEDITQVCKHPVLAAIPDMTAQSKGGHYDSGSKKSAQSGKAGSMAFIGGNVSFAASEAYKLLRTKLQFSFADETKCRVIGVSSAMTGEGKSLSAVNLAYTLSQLNKKVLLIDCDMRRPSLSTKLPIDKAPGLSNYLSGQNNLDRVMQPCGIKNEENVFHVISSGNNPPNPVELLSSSRMAGMLEFLREYYDYVILDLPPVGEVSDALTVSKVTDGMILVTRHNYGNRVALNDTVRQFEFVGAKILGIVYNCVSENGAVYGKKYYKRYYKAYEGSYATASKKTNKSHHKTLISK